MRTAGALVILLASSSIAGCAILAGYDFGSYTAREGSGGGGGASSSSTTATGGGGGSASTTAASSGGGQGGGVGGSGGNAGGGGSGPVDVVLYSGSKAPTSIALAGDKVYFATDVSGGGMGTVERRDKDGTNPKTLISGLDAPSSLTLDAGFVYFATFDPVETVGRVSTGGGTVGLITSDASPVGGAAASGNFVYWSRTTAGEIRRAQLDGSNPSAIVTSADAASLIVADGDGVYWLSVGTLNGNDSQILRADLDGQNAHAIATNQDFPVAITTDATRVYWSTIHGGISSRVKTEATGPTVYQAAAANLQSVDGIAAFGGAVFATEDKALFSFPIAGGASTTIRQGLDGPRYLAVDADSICYTTISQTAHDNLVVRIPR